MKLLFLSVGAGLAALAACTTHPVNSPNMAGKQVLVGARAGDKLAEGAETYVAGERVGDGAPGAEHLNADDENALAGELPRAEALEADDEDAGDDDASEAVRPPGR